MLLTFIALVIVFAWWAPQSWLGRKLGGAVARAERRLAAVPTAAWVVFFLGLFGLVALVAYGRFDGAIMAGMAAPELLATIASVDIGIGIEMLAAAWLISARGGWRATAQVVRRIVRRRGVRRVARAPRPRRLKAAANDDDPDGAIGQGVARAA